MTRDRRYGEADWGPARFRSSTPAVFDPSAEGILGAMRQQSLRALDEADLVVFVVDAREGVTAVDEDVRGRAPPVGRPVLVAANKVDSDKAEAAAAETFTLGFPQVFPISAEPWPRRRRHARRHRRRAPQGGGGGPARRVRSTTADDPATPLRLAFIGKPNVGKSSLVNCLLGEERVLVHDQPGTTRDPIDTPFSFGGREYVLVDTAGCGGGARSTRYRARRGEDGARSAGSLRRGRSGDRRPRGGDRRGRAARQPD